MMYNAKLMTGNLHKLMIPKVFAELLVLWEDIGGITRFSVSMTNLEAFSAPSESSN
jgi:hypothetical protein